MTSEPSALHVIDSSGPISRATPGTRLAWIALAASCGAILLGHAAAIAGIVLGHVAFASLRRDGGDGRGVAVAAIITGWLMFVLSTVLAVVLFFAVSFASLLGPWLLVGLGE